MKRVIHRYSESALAEALKLIREGKIGIRQASREYGVPKTTLLDRITGRIADGVGKMGPKTILSQEEEDKLVDWLIKMAKCGFPLKQEELLNVVEKIIREEKRTTPFKDNRPGKKWYYSFLKRHPELALRTPEPISNARAVITDEEIRKWFKDLRDFLISENSEDILLDARRIFNADETAFSMAPKVGTVIAPKGYHNVFQVTPGNDKETLTVLLSFAASGETLPPMVVFPYVRPPAKVVNSMPDDWILGRLETGWMRTETFYEYVGNGFHEWLNRNNIRRPVLFLVDGHKSHLSMELSEFCSNNAIILYALPPNTTHILQPADVGAFKALKSDYKKTVREWQRTPQNIGRAVTKTNFCEILKSVLDKSDRKEIVKNAFKKCGIYPFNPDAVDYLKCVQDNLENLGEPQKIYDSTNCTPSITNQDYNVAKKVIFCLKDNILKNNIEASVIDVIIGEIDNAINCNAGENIGTTNPQGPIYIEGTYEVGTNDELVRIPENTVPVDGSEVTSNRNENIMNIPGDQMETNQGIQNEINSENCNKENINPSDCSNPSSFMDYNNCPGPSSSFDRYLAYPSKIITKKGKTHSNEERPPMSISSRAWKEFHINKNRLKRDKSDEIEERKKQRLLKRANTRRKKNAPKTCKRSSGKLTSKIQCHKCEDVLDTDAEEDEYKNIGCDKCEKWYHLKCTRFSGMPFNEAENQDFICCD